METQKISAYEADQPPVTVSCLGKSYKVKWGYPLPNLKCPAIYRIHENRMFMRRGREYYREYYLDPQKNMDLWRKVEQCALVAIKEGVN